MSVERGSQWGMFTKKEHKEWILKYHGMDFLWLCYIWICWFRFGSRKKWKSQRCYYILYPSFRKFCPFIQRFTFSPGKTGKTQHPRIPTPCFMVKPCGCSFHAKPQSWHPQGRPNETICNWWLMAKVGLLIWSHKDTKSKIHFQRWGVHRTTQKNMNHQLNREGGRNVVSKKCPRSKCLMPTWFLRSEAGPLHIPANVPLCRPRLLNALKLT